MPDLESELLYKALKKAHCTQICKWYKTNRRGCKSARKIICYPNFRKTVATILTKLKVTPRG